MSLNIIEKGSGYPVVFAHTCLWDAKMWTPQIDELSKEYHCLNIELWSHGGSPNIPKPSYSIEELAEDYHQTIHKRGIKEFVFIGLSIGGLIGIELALKYPKSVKALAVIASSAKKEPEKTWKEYLGLMDYLKQEGRITEDFAHELATYYFRKETYKNNYKLIDQFTKNLTAYPKERIQGIIAIGCCGFKRKDKMKYLSNIKCPTLYMTGDEDTVRPPHESEEMAKITPHSECIIIPDAAHIPNLEQPEIMTNHLKTFLNKNIQLKHAV